MKWIDRAGLPSATIASLLWLAAAPSAFAQGKKPNYYRHLWR